MARIVYGVSGEGSGHSSRSRVTLAHLQHLGHTVKVVSYELPLISIDNQHRLRYMHYDCPAELKQDQQLTKDIIRAMIPSLDVALVSTFYQGKPINDRTFLFPPILREEVNAILDRLTALTENDCTEAREFRRQRKEN